MSRKRLKNVTVRGLYMKNLEKLKLRLLSDKDAERLTRWLYEWNLMQASDNNADNIINHSIGGQLDVLPDGYVANYDDNIEVGQIRLMAPVENETMLFIVVVSIEENKKVSFIPFSPLSEPATPDELLNGRDQAVVSVYCLWNLKKVPATVICNSWIVDMLNSDELEHLLYAINIYESIGCLPDDLLTDTGPPLIHPEDPRREYINIERHRIDKAILHNNSKKNLMLYEADIEQEFLKAAESPESYDV